MAPLKIFIHHMVRGLPRRDVTADNLESIVQQRTGELIEEKQKTDMLLNRMLPPYVYLPGGL